MSVSYTEALAFFRRSLWRPNLARAVFVLFRRTIEAFWRNDCQTLAAAIAYYGLFSLFPLILGLLAILGIFLNSHHWQAQVLARFSDFFPGSEVFVAENVRAVLRIQGELGILAIAGLLWGGKAVFSAISTGINRAWGIRQGRRLWETTLLEMALVLATGLFFAVSVVVTAMPDIVHAVSAPQLGLGILRSDVWRGFVQLSPIILAFGAFLLLYKVMPNTQVEWIDVLPGAVFSTVVFEVAKNLFVLYSTSYVRYEYVYGSVGTVIGLLLWAYISGFVLLLGAELSSEFAKSRRGLSPWTGDT
jgi:membrane protein